MGSGAGKQQELIVVTVEMGVGGAERVLSLLVDAWLRQGHSVTLIQTRPGLYGQCYALNPQLETVNIVAKGTNKATRYAGETMGLLKYLRRRPEATIIAFANASIRIVGVCSFLIHNRIIFSERCDPERTPDSKLMRLLRDQLFKLADRCVFQTKDALRHFPKSVQKKGIVIPNPVKSDLPAPWTGPRRKVIVTACRLAPQKNLPLLICAFAQVRQRHPDYSLEIYGSGDEKDKLSTLIEALGLQAHALLMGHTDTLHERIRDCAMYVCSSDFEGISNSVLEAMALGLPVISTDCPVGGARELIENGRNGLLVPVNDQAALQDAMHQLIEQPALADRLGQTAAGVKDQFAVDRIAKRWLEI